MGLQRHRESKAEQEGQVSWGLPDGNEKYEFIRSASYVLVPPSISIKESTPMVFLSHTSEATKWLMHVLSPCDPLIPLQYIAEMLDSLALGSSRINKISTTPLLRSRHTIRPRRFISQYFSLKYQQQSPFLQSASLISSVKSENDIYSTLR